MNAQWQTLSARMAALSGRERALILLVCLALIGLPLIATCRLLRKAGFELP